MHPTPYPPYRPRHVRQPPHVYRRRRAVAATVVLVAVAGTMQLAGALRGGGDTDGEGATATSSSTTTTAPPPPDCVEGDTVVGVDPDQAWATVRIDTDRALPPEYGPPDLVDVVEAGFPPGTGVTVRRHVIEDLALLREAAEDNGTALGILAGYRSYASQADLLQRRVDEFGENEALSRVARPGHSEHQLGTTVDVTDAGATDVDQSWGTTPAGRWVAANAHRYGFALSFPQGAMARTCFDYEPWHLRYVGRDHTAALIESGLTLREYQWRLEEGIPTD